MESAGPQSEWTAHLGQTEVNEDPRTVGFVKEKVGGLDIAVNDPSNVSGAKSSEEFSEIAPEEIGRERAVVVLCEAESAVRDTLTKEKQSRLTRKSSLQWNGMTTMI
jgi:hypothetical protein